jgi:hypothetical protein
MDLASADMSSFFRSQPKVIACSFKPRLGREDSAEGIIKRVWKEYID